MALPFKGNEDQNCFGEDPLKANSGYQMYQHGEITIGLATATYDIVLLDIKTRL